MAAETELTKGAADERRRTAIHEAGRAVLYIVLGLGLKRVTIERNVREGEEGHAAHGGEWGEEDDDTATLRMVAEDAFWLRHASANYAGAEAVRRSGAKDAGAELDNREAANNINRITSDEQSIELLFRLAKRRCEVLVEYYWPEIQALADALLKHSALDGKAARQVFFASLKGRGARLLTWSW